MAAPGSKKTKSGFAGDAGRRKGILTTAKIEEPGGEGKLKTEVSDQRSQGEQKKPGATTIDPEID